MSTSARDSFALYLIAGLAILVTLGADVDLGRLFTMILSRL